MIDPMTTPSILADPLDAAIMINDVIKTMEVFKYPVTFEVRKQNQDNLIKTYRESPSKLDEDQTAMAEELIDKREKMIEYQREYHQNNKEKR